MEGNMGVKMLILFLVIAIVMALSSGLIYSETYRIAKNNQIIENITPEAAYSLINRNKDNPDFIIVDLRTPQEFETGHIKNTTNIDYYSKTFKGELEKLDKDKTYLIYCQTGGRSGRCLKIMKQLGFKEVYNISGGILDWGRSGLPITIK